MPDQLSLNDNCDVLHLMDLLFEDCLRLQVSDLHFEPFFQSHRLRLRYQGQLHLYDKLPQNILKKIIQRFKALAHLHLTEQKIPQDGQWLWQHHHRPKSIPCRLNTCPVLYGEKLVVRLLQHPFEHATWSDLGMSPSQSHIIEKHLTHNQGLILVNGPTGSGKTTTLYTALKFLKHEHKNIMSIEDPIEIPYPAINQVEICPQQGFDLNQTLRAVLRQDPDILLIGEIRDFETAHLAFEAAQTGHLVLSSLHSTDCLSSIDRLQHLGIPAHDIESNLHLIIAQKMISKKSGDQMAIFEFLEFQKKPLEIQTPFQNQLFQLYEQQLIDYSVLLA